MNNKFLAAGSVALMGAGSLLGATPANAFTEADCGTVPADAFLELLGEDICSVTFDINSETAWEVPAGIDRLAAVLIGGGGCSMQMSNTGYGGGGGEVIYIDDVDPADLADLTIGGPGNALPELDGGDTTLGSYVAEGGIRGEDYDGAGTSGSGNAAAFTAGTSTNLFGGGAKTAATSSAIGAGYVLSDPDLTNDDPFFSDAFDTIEMGKGGSPLALPNSVGYGEGGSADADDALSNAGETGAAIFRWSLTDVNTDSETPLAATGVDANAIGMTAGALGLGGVALAVVAAARRARRVK